jgi:hypothetical protein
MTSRSEAKVYQLKGFQNRSSSARLDRFADRRIRAPR